MKVYVDNEEYDEDKLPSVDGKECPHCTNPAAPPHTCPFSEEVDGDSESLCTCCEECEGRCLEDI